MIELFNELFRECSICLERLILHRKRLSCGHVFHSRCVKMLHNATKCPICLGFIFDEKELQLLKSTSIKNSIDILNTIDPDRIIPHILREAIDRQNLQLVNLIINKYDPSRLVYEYIAEKKANNLKLIINSRLLNWHSTCNNKTIIETALDSKHESVIDIILNGMPRIEQRLYPILPSNMGNA